MYQAYYGQAKGCTFKNCDKYVYKFMGFVSQLATYVVQSPNVDALLEKNIIGTKRFPKDELVHLDVTEAAICRVI